MSRLAGECRDELPPPSKEEGDGQQGEGGEPETDGMSTDSFVYAAAGPVCE